VIVRRICVGAAALVAGAAVAGCSSSAAPLPGEQHSTRPTTATQWWSATDYCGILRQTMKAGHSVLAGVTAEDPALLVATKTFVTELTASAPSEIRTQWQVLGPALLQLVESGGKLSAVSGVNTRQVSAAATAIAADAKTRCHVDVSA
jgi:hypothetical protein